MKIVAVTYGSRGDVQPMLALVLALQSAGHSIHMVAPPENADWVQRYGCQGRRPAAHIPHILDQFYLADRIRALGLGPKPIWRSKLTSKRLVAAITEAVSNESFRRRAHEISLSLKKQNSLANATRLIESESFLS